MDRRGAARDPGGGEDQLGLRRAGLQVPHPQVVLVARDQVARGRRRPAHRQQARVVIRQLGGRDRRHPDVHDDGRLRVRPECGQIIGINWIPCDFQEGPSIWCLVDDRRVVQGADVEETKGSISTDGNKSLRGFGRKGRIEHLLVMCNQLRFNRA